MKILLLILIVAILLAVQLVMFKEFSKAAEQDDRNEGKPITQFFIRNWWLAPILIVVFGFFL